MHEKSTLQDIYQTLYQHTQIKTKGEQIKELKISKYLIGGAVVVFIIAMIGALSIRFISDSWKPEITNVVYGSVLISQLLAMLHQITFIFSTVIFIKNSAQHAYDSLATKSKGDLDVVTKLAVFDKMLLITVKERLEHEKEIVYSKIGVVAGAIDKTGFIMALFTISIAYLKLSDSLPESYEFSEYLMYVTGGLYLAALTAYSILNKLRQSAFIIELAIKYNEEAAKRNTINNDCLIINQTKAEEGRLNCK